MYKTIMSYVFLPVMLGLHYWLGWDWILIVLGSMYIVTIGIFILGTIVILKTRESVDLSTSTKHIKWSAVLWVISFAYYTYIGSYILIGLLAVGLVSLLGFYIVNVDYK